MVSKKDRRRHIRYDTEVSVYLKNDQGILPAKLANISEGGMLLVTEVEMPVGSGFCLEFRALTKESCQAYGRLIRKQKDGFAVQFLFVDDRYKDFVRDLQALPLQERSRFLESVIDPVIKTSVTGDNPCPLEDTDLRRFLELEWKRAQGKPDFSLEEEWYDLKRRIGCQLYNLKTETTFRRSALRIPVDLPVKLMGVLDGRARNLSMTGILVEARDRLGQIGDEIEMEINGEDLNVGLLCTITRAAQMAARPASTFLVGMQFCPMTDDQKQKVLLL